MKTSSLRSRIPTGLAASGLALLFVVLACEVEPPTAEMSSDGDAPETTVSGDFIVGALQAPDGATPLFVVDGTPLESAEVRELDSDDIESVAVLKGAAAASRFGEEASVGVVLITTKGADGPNEDQAAGAEYLEGKVAGATILRRQGPDASSEEVAGQVRISGESQGDEDERPLVVVDGVPGVELGGDSAELDASNIESVEVLKGAAAVELYGERARHGVILIKTRN